MPRIRSISARLLITISLITALTCAVLAVFSVIQQRALIRLALDRELDLAYRSVIAAFDYEGRVARAIASVIAALPEVAPAVAAGDRDGLAFLREVRTA